MLTTPAWLNCERLAGNRASSRCEQNPHWHSTEKKKTETEPLPVPLAPDL
jgi:hypothetical protein